MSVHENRAGPDYRKLKRTGQRYLDLRLKNRFGMMKKIKYFLMRFWWWWFSHWVISDTYDPKDCSLPGSSVHGISQTRITEWVAISFSRIASQPRNQTCNSCLAGRFFTNWATREALMMFYIYPVNVLFGHLFAEASFQKPRLPPVLCIYFCFSIHSHIIIDVHAWLPY